MKININIATTTAILVALTAPALGASRAEAKLEERITSYASKLDVLQTDPKKMIPPEVLEGAQGIVIMHHVKAGFVFGLKGANGVALVRDAQTKQWTAPAFMAGGEGSFGFQAGVQQGTLVYVLMNEEGLEILKDPKAKIGVDMRATAGPHSAGDEANFTTGRTPVLVYSDISGIFGGLSFQGGAIHPDKGSNKKMYDATAEGILFQKKAKPTSAGQTLIKTLEKYSKEK